MQTDNSYTIRDSIDSRLIEQYLNTYFRETGVFAPTWDTRSDQDRQAIEIVGQHRAAFRHLFDCSNVWLIGSINYLSDGGFHRYDDKFALLSVTTGEISPLSSEEKSGVEKLFDLIVAQLGDEGNSSNNKRQRLLTLMRNSHQRVRHYLSNGKDPLSKTENRATTDVFRRSEQGLLFGHPFHVTSKACDGFDLQDIGNYSPEQSADYQLSYFAVSPEIVWQEKSRAQSIKLDQLAIKQAAEKLPDLDKYILHPCHPWQAKYLLQQEQVKKWQQANKLIYLGELGEVVWPTSSVRTVWLPQQKCYKKLSINVRITNFIRNNPPEQLRRALDVSKLVYRLQPELEQHFQLLAESAFQTFSCTDNELQAAAACLFRDGQSDNQQPQVVAYLLEENPFTGEIPLVDEMRQAASDREELFNSQFVVRWWQAYLKISLVPLLELFAHHGLSLEAHLQNCMIALEDGWPRVFYVRDMEGGSISRGYVSSWRGLISEDSSALYDQETAWFRLKYYALINHFSHFISALGRSGFATEQELWSMTREIIQQGSESEAYQALITDLLTAETLPAKANMLSSFDQHGEKPSWVEIPNPLKTKSNCVTASRFLITSNNVVGKNNLLANSNEMENNNLMERSNLLEGNDPLESNKAMEHSNG